MKSFILNYAKPIKVYYNILVNQKLIIIYNIKYLYIDIDKKFINND